MKAILLAYFSFKIFLMQVVQWLNSHFPGINYSLEAPGHFACLDRSPVRKLDSSPVGQIAHVLIIIIINNNDNNINVIYVPVDDLLYTKLTFDVFFLKTIRLLIN